MRKFIKQITMPIIRHLTWLPDRLYLRLRFLIELGYPLRLNRPQTFNEKLQWLKLNYRHPAMSVMVDKYRARDFVAKRIGRQYLIPLLGVWEKAEDIDFETLPRQFVIKCNHNSGNGMYICKDKSLLDISAVRDGLAEGLKENYYITSREWPYKDVPRRIVAEEFLIDKDSPEESLRDYKFFCFNGIVEFFKIDLDRFSNHRANYYDRDGKLTGYGETNYPPNPDRKVDMPAVLPKMIQLAECLAAGFPFLRVDFYNIGSKIYFGELTFYPAAGFGDFTPAGTDANLGKLLTLPDSL